MDAPDDTILVPHPKRDELLEAYARQVEMQLARGNYQAARDVIETAYHELEMRTVSLDDHVAVLCFEPRFLGWLELRGIATIAQLLRLDKTIELEPRFEKHWLEVIDGVRRQFGNDLEENE